ncbi:MAG: hypothetical protein XXXJIFNMEKO3_01648 [Candidatus Erwinia impunctatus]|nr:hypothetical protein XXXJIFNMEKO_01648 [Culicoides impunctatus]
MKSHKIDLAGNVLMAVGMILMFLGIGYAIAHDIIALELPQYAVYLAIMLIFVGALLWLLGALLGGHEKITNRYYWISRYGNRR